MVLLRRAVVLNSYLVFKRINLYRTFFVFMVGLGGFLKLDLVWVIADIVNGLMALPNLIAF